MRRDTQSHRERMLRAIEFRNPDRIPRYYHSSTAGLYTHGKKLLDLFNAFPPDNEIEFKEIPQPAPGTVNEAGEYYATRIDPWQTTWEYRIFGIQGQPLHYPLSDISMLDSYKMPAIPEEGDERFLLERAAVEKKEGEYLIFRGGISLFEKLMEIRPMDDVLIELLTEDRTILRVLDLLVEHGIRRIRHLIAIGVDVIMIGDDWGTQNGPVVSPDLFRKLYKPRYRRLFDEIRKGGAKILLHTCGKLDEIFDEFVDLGINCIWPQINRFEESTFVETCRKNKVALFIHPDRQRLIPLGTPEEIRRTIRHYADIYHELGGGGIFYIEIENDAPFENVEALVESASEFA